MNDVPLILASSSVSRRMMLEAAGVRFTVIAPNVNEDSMKEVLTRQGADAGAVADALAEAKAITVSERHADALVLGADQVLRCGEQVFSKAVDQIEAKAALLALKGAEHELISAVVLARGGVPVWRRSESAWLRMRDFSDAFLDAYLTAELPDILGSVGCYRIEGRGAQLFAEVKGDQFCIRGLPLVAVLGALRQFGALAS
jgi:septum formation protein